MPYVEEIEAYLKEYGAVSNFDLVRRSAQSQSVPLNELVCSGFAQAERFGPQMDELEEDGGDFMDSVAAVGSFDKEKWVFVASRFVVADARDA